MEDVCVARFNQFAAKMSNVLYLLKGEVNSFLIQLQDEEVYGKEEMEARFNLHFKASIEKAVLEFPDSYRKLEEEIIDVGNAIFESGYPVLAKTRWLKYLTFFNEVFESLKKIRVPRENYEKTCRSILEVLKDLEEFMHKFSENIEIFSRDSSFTRGMKHLNNVEKLYQRLEENLCRKNLYLKND